MNKDRHIKARMFSALFLLTATFSSCGDFLEEYSQDTSYVRGYNDLDELLLGDGYMPTANPPHIGQAETSPETKWYYPYIHFMGDELEQNINSYTGNGSSFDAGEKYFGYYTWQQQVGIDPTGTEISTEDGDWTAIYKHINIANMVIAQIDGQSGSSEEDEQAKRRIKGEAYFLRGAYYFTLANLYGKPYNPATAATDLAVPLKLSDYIEDRDYKRNSVEEVYSQAISDLTEAESLLQGTTRKSYYRANQTAARLLLSRLYLYKQDWSKAIEYGEKVLQAGDNELEDLNTFSASFFLNPDLSEIIFTMGNGGLRLSVTGNSRDFGVSPYVAGLYTADDLRSKYFVKVNDEGGYPEYVKGGEPSDISRSALSANFLLRTAEAFLNVAEAAAYAGDEDKARLMLNDLRQKRINAGKYKDVTLSGAELIDMIRDERERELCLEGHRWFDLRRYTVNVVRPFTKTIKHGFTTFKYDWQKGSVPVQTRYYQLDENDDAYTLPIPKEVVNFSNGMTNNARKQRTVIETINY